jgi:molybdate transport system regulatory protein
VAGKPKQHRRSHRPLKLRGRAWVEIARSTAFTEAGADLLEQIEACGSLSEAARRLSFSYRRAWMLIDAMNRYWPRPLVITAVGGKRGGGTRLTDLGRDVLSAYRDLQIQLEFLLNRCTEAFSILSRSPGTNRPRRRGDR